MTIVARSYSCAALKRGRARPGEKSRGNILAAVARAGARPGGLLRGAEERGRIVSTRAGLASDRQARLYRCRLRPHLSRPRCRRISSVACLEFKTTRPNCYASSLPTLLLFHPDSPCFPRRLALRPSLSPGALTSRERARTKGKLRASGRRWEKRHSGGLKENIATGQRGGREKGFGARGGATSRRETVLAAECRVTCVQGLNERL